MKTTVEIDDGLFRAAKQHAATSGVSFRETAEAALRQYLFGNRPLPGSPYKLDIEPFHGQGLQPGIEDGNWEQIRELAYGEAPE